MKFRSALATGVALACLSTVALASGVQFRGTTTIGDVAQDAEKVSLEFSPRTGTLLGGTVVSDTVRYDGPTLSASVSDGQVRVCPTSACGSDGGWVAQTQVKAGQFVQIRRAGPQAPGATVTAALEIAGQRFAFDATARSQSPSFDAIAAASAGPGEAKDSGLSTFHGWVEAPIAVSGGEYRVCSSQGSCGSFTTANGTVRDGDQVQLRVVAGAFGETRTASVTAGGASASFKVDVRTKDITPDAIALGDGPTSVEPASVASSQTATLAGFDDAAISIVGGEYALNGGSFTTASGTAKAGDTVQVRLTTGAFGETSQATLTVGDTTATFSATTRVKDTVPNPFAFSVVGGSNPGATVVSSIVTLRSFDDAPISVTGGEYALNGGAFTSATGTAKAGDRVQLRGVSPAFGQTQVVSLDVGGVRGNAAIVSRAKDETPDAFALGTGPTGVEPGSVSTSETATLAGFDDAAISVTGTGASYSINGGAFVSTAGTAKAGDQVRVQLTAGAFGETRAGTLTVGGATATWSSTVRARDLVPDTITFPDLADQTAGASVVSAIRQLTGHDGVTVTVSGAGAQVRACASADCASGAWGTTAEVAKDAYVQLRTTTGASSATVVASLAYGTTTPATWTVKTRNTSSNPVGALYAWGANSQGQFGNGTTTASSVPVPVSFPTGVTSFTNISTFNETACATGSDDALYCWGNNGNGQVGIGSTIAQTTPRKVSLPTGVTSLREASVGYSHVCAIGSDDAAYCWGLGTSGEIGDGTSNSRTTPWKVALPTGVTKLSKISAGYQTTCAVGSDDAAYCWGSNSNMQIGDNSSSNRLRPTKVVVPSGETRLDNPIAGHVSTCATGSSGASYCWGYNAYGQLGDGTSADKATPSKVTMPTGVARFTSLFVGVYVTCGNGSDGNAYCWGYGNEGAIGNGSTSGRTTPTKVSLPSGTTSIRITDTGLYRTCGVGSDDNAYCWGFGSGGAIGNGGASNVTVPTRVSIPSGLNGLVGPVTGWQTTYAIGR